MYKFNGRCWFVGYCIAITAWLTACTSIDPNSDYVIVVPIKWVPPPPPPARKYTYGWTETTPEEATSFKVRIGDLRYHKIIEPYLVNGHVPLETAISESAKFAEQEVVSRGLCKSARVALKNRILVGSNNPSEVWMNVECIKPE